MPAQGFYIAQADIEAIVGVDNVRLWSQLDNDIVTADEDRIQTAIDEAEAQIEARFRQGRYAVPLVESGSNGILPIKRLIARQAAIYLYAARGSNDTGEAASAEAGRMADIQEQIDREIRAYTAGTRTLLLTRVDTEGNSPQAIRGRGRQWPLE